MENAASALKMGAAILIFIIAIGTSFSLFGTAKQTADSIITMRDKQKYLEAASLDSVLYISSDKISQSLEDGSTSSIITGLTTGGDRIVGRDDVISTIYRYAKEKYGVTIVKSDGTVIARFDSGTESLMNQYSNLTEDGIKKHIADLNANTKNNYITTEMYKFTSISNNTLKEIYGESKAAWYGSHEDIQKRINSDISYGQCVFGNGQRYQGKNLLEELKNSSKIVEVTNEIDNSTYLKQTDENGNYIDENGNITEDDDKVIDSNLLQQYQMSTVEIIYILYS